MTQPPKFAGWFKSSYSEPSEGCVEVAFAFADDGTVVGVRDSKDPSGPVLALAEHAWQTFVRRLPDLQPE